MRVYQDFSADPGAAVQKYREVWSAYQPEDISDDRMFIASEMMRHDLDRREDYYRFIVAHVRKEGGAYRTSALRALAYATGTESLEILFEAYESREDMAAREALQSIKLRYEYAKAVGDSNEMAFVKKRSSEALKRLQAPQ
ncbi:hypothetical protein LYSHEL_26960 [Lysobacter helvus]|uniref:HEAT repeat domain-containing protein n=2 Tax=Lysobacteraceae TaxID=32033 RepID=A0ABM7Q886_9GAMM|nr:MULTISPECIES: hypothetical protein [Lysobacter]BCT93669.1 hypothetical protein LYSCAS_26930 [Lysobacter caseinilyticus]BCT96825.1 hypothetical protein LYSHEL_26960 [Lysobacter helvus]